MKKSIRMAVDNGEAVRARTLLTKVEALRPMDEMIPELRNKVAALENKAENQDKQDEKQTS